MIYTDYRGQQSSPNKDSIVIERSSIWAIITDSQNRRLISHPQFDLNTMELPGGGIEAGEDRETSLIREIIEEAGVEFKTLTPKKTFNQHVEYACWDKDEFWNYDQEYWVIKLKDEKHYFSGKRKTEEGAYGEWVALSSIRQNNFHFMHYEAMKKMEGI